MTYTRSVFDEFDSEEILQQFRERYDQATLAEAAERFLKEKAAMGRCLLFMHDGLITYTIRRLLIDDLEPSRVTDDLVNRLVDLYGFLPDWVPPRLLVREALAHTVHRRGLIQRLQREFGGTGNFAAVFDRAASHIGNSKEAFLLDDEFVDAVIGKLRRSTQ